MDTNETLENWAELELAAWRGYARRGAALGAVLRHQAEHKQSVFLFHLEDGEVRFDDKSAGYASPPEDHYRDALVVRGRLYRDFLEAAARMSAKGISATGRSGTLAFDLEDIGQPRFSVPVFAFQKLAGANTILLPDVDFLVFGFYEEATHDDPLPFEAKEPSAMFVGSTTGDPMLTAEMVRTLANRRLRSAVFFKDRNGVVFDLPNIVQADSPETHELIVALDVAGVRRDWAEQLQKRYILSMDGNGATCSRVALALRSNSVLLKYNSDFRLHYFHGLEPWVHFIPIIRDEDVIELLAEAPLHEGLHRDVAERSRQFADRHLTRDSALAYTATLLDRYLERFFG